MTLIANCSQNLIWRTIICHFYCRNNDALCLYWSHRPTVTNFSRLADLAVIFSAA